MPDATTASVLLVAALGLAAGSFLNVCIYRLPRGLSPVAPRSRCTSCGTELRWRDNIPVLSYLFLGGRCHACRAPISPMYPIVEISASLLVVVTFLRFGPTLLFASRAVFALALTVLCAIDLRHRILPNRITVPGIGVGFALSFFGPPGWQSSLLGTVAGGGLLLLIAEVYYRVRGEEGLGMGDVKMIAMIGAFLGWQSMLVALVLSSVLGSVVGLAMIAARKGDMKYALPFGSFLAAGALVASLFGDAIVAWYLGFY
ncbi:MAG: A24 family peptidase [Vicinamibacterales bacterium]